MNKYGYQSVWQVEEGELFTSYADLVEWVVDNAHTLFGHTYGAYEYAVVKRGEENARCDWDVWVKVTDLDETDEEVRYGEEWVTVRMLGDALVTKRF